MTRKKRGAKKSQRVLADHKRDRRKLVPPLMQLPGLHEVSWFKEMLPDFLWLALMLGRRSDWRAAYSALEVIDRFVPVGPRFADGRLTTFALVPAQSRAEARRALSVETPHALPEQFAHAIGLYPTCPARWLYEEWLEDHDPDPDVGLPLVRSIIADHTDKGGVRETRLRMAAISRRVTHDKLSHSGEGTMKLVPKYPNGLSEPEQRQVESVMRAMWGSTFGWESEKYPEILDWPREFWKRNRELVGCRVEVREREEVVMPEEDGPVDPEPLMQLSELRAVLDALAPLGEQLRTVQQELVADPDADEPNAVLLGLASRLFSLLYAFLERPSAWAPGTAGFFLRPLVDTRILVGWFITRDDPEIYAAYREHGLGRLKLLREHIKADLGDDPDEETKEMLDYLDRRVNFERDEWFQAVNLGSFANINPRQMAEEASLKRAYDLTYAPLSSSNHGEWPTVRENDTVLCQEPLHGNHRLGAFAPPSHTISGTPAFLALDLAREGICQVFDYYERDIREKFDQLQTALDEAA
jgi:hypothetical protein